MMEVNNKLPNKRETKRNTYVNLYAPIRRLEIHRPKLNGLRDVMDVNAKIGIVGLETLEEERVLLRRGEENLDIESHAVAIAREVRGPVPEVRCLSNATY